MTSTTETRCPFVFGVVKSCFWSSRAMLDFPDPDGPVTRQRILSVPIWNSFLKMIELWLKQESDCHVDGTWLMQGQSLNESDIGPRRVMSWNADCFKIHTMKYARSKNIYGMKTIEVAWRFKYVCIHKSSIYTWTVLYPRTSDQTKALGDRSCLSVSERFERQSTSPSTLPKHTFESHKSHSFKVKD